MRTNRNRIEFDEHVVRRYPLTRFDRANLAAIARRHRDAREAGLPVPAVLAVHRDHLVLERAGGTPFMETTLTDEAQHRLGGQLAQIAQRMRQVRVDYTDVPQWARLWQVLAQVAPTPESRKAAATASHITTALVHGDLSGGNLLVSPDGDLIAVLDWDGAALADPAQDFAALCFNCGPQVADALRAATPEADELEHRAAIYLATWPLQHELWATGRHPWLAGDRALTEPRGRGV